MALSFRDWLTTVIAPVWLRRTWGAKFLGVMGDQADRLAQAAKDAVKAGMPDQGSPSDALPYNGKARNIERYTADTDTTYRSRVTTPWDVWEFAGTTTGLLNHLHEQGYANVRIYSWSDLQPNVPDPYGRWYSAFWVWIDPPSGINTDGTWGSPGTWDDTAVGPPSGPGVWDCDMTLYRVNELRASIRKWKPAHEICAGIRILLAGDSWDNVTPWDNGTWSDSSTAQIVLKG